MRRIREKNTRLVLAMLQHRHSNRSLARAAGVGEQTISRAVNLRQEPCLYTRVQISRVLDVPVAELFPEGGAQ